MRPQHKCMRQPCDRAASLPGSSSLMNESLRGYSCVSVVFVCICNALTALLMSSTLDGVLAPWRLQPGTLTCCVLTKAISTASLGSGSVSACYCQAGRCCVLRRACVGGRAACVLRTRTHGRTGALAAGERRSLCDNMRSRVPGLKCMQVLLQPRVCCVGRHHLQRHHVTGAICQPARVRLFAAAAAPVADRNEAPSYMGSHQSSKGAWFALKSPGATTATR